MTTVLLIEDSEDAMALIRHALKQHGKGEYSLLWADNLLRGLEHLEKKGIDVVLLDLGLPESQGPTSYAWVREVAPNTPIVVLTGDASEETAYSVLASGAEEYLVKGKASGLLVVYTIQQAMLDESERKGRMCYRVTKGWPE